MSPLWAVVRREFLERVRSRWFIISTLGDLFFKPLLLIHRIVQFAEGVGKLAAGDE